MLNSNDQDRLELSLAAAARRDAELQAAAAAERQQSRQRRRQQRRQLVAWLHGRRRYVRGMVVGAALAMLAVTLLPRELMNLALIGAVMAGVGLCIEVSNEPRNRRDI